MTYRLVFGYRHVSGVLLHRFSDWLHLLAHRLINDPEWRMRNG